MRLGVTKGNRATNRERVIVGAGGVTYTVTRNDIDGNAWILVEAYND